MTVRISISRPIRVQALSRASSILDVLAETDGGWTPLARLSRATGLQKTTVHNLLSSLVALGFVEQHKQTREYRLGLRNLELGRIVQNRLTIVPLVRPSLIRLSAKTRETASLAVPSGLDVLVVESLEGSYGVRVAAYTGSRLPYHATACGKSILAHLPREFRTAILGARPLEALTPRTIVDRAVLEAELDQVRDQGYATNVEESQEDTSCVGAPLFGADGDILGAISLDAPTHRMSEDRTAQMVGLVLKEAATASAMLKRGDEAGSRQRPSRRRSPPAVQEPNPTPGPA